MTFWEMTAVNPDTLLLFRLSRGEKEAYEAVFMRYYVKVRRFILGILRDTGAAEDLTQDVFLKIWINREKLPAIVSFDNYLFTIARNVACDYLRRQQSSRKYALSELDSEDYICHVQVDCDRERLERAIGRCIDTMPAQRKLVYRLSREELLSNAEIAEHLQLSKRTVDRHLSLALSDIRAAIGQFVSGAALFFCSHWV